MKRTLSTLILVTSLGALSWAQDASTVVVAPSDQVRYPDPAAILNKTDPKMSTLPSAKPLIGTTPIPARTAPSTIPAGSQALSRGWYLRWIVSGDEASVQAWAKTLAAPALVVPAGEGFWEVLAGPLDATNLPQALSGQAGQASLVRR